MTKEERHKKARKRHEIKALINKIDADNVDEIKTQLAKEIINRSQDINRQIDLLTNKIFELQNEQKLTKCFHPKERNNYSHYLFSFVGALLEKVENGEVDLR